jgi:hypothetical protein
MMFFPLLSFDSPNTAAYEIISSGLRLTAQIPRAFSGCLFVQFRPKNHASTHPEAVEGQEASKSS